MKLSICLFFVSIITLSTQVPAPSFQFKDCGKSNAIVRFEEVSVKPDPVYFDGLGESTIIYNIRQDLPLDAFLRVDLWNGNRIAEEALKDEERTPCLLGPVCEIAVCDWMQLEYYSCMSYHNSTSYCTCPVKAGIRSDINEKFIFPSKYLLPLWFNEGTYTSRFTIMDGSRNELGCLLMSGTVVHKQS